MLKARLILFIGLFFLTQEPSSRADDGWVRHYNGPGNGHDNASALAVGANGNVYVTGGSIGSGPYGDYATIKYAPNGDTLWVRRYNGPANSDDSPSALALDGSGNLYVTGYSYGSGTYSDYATIKYAPNGDTLWVRRYNGPGNSDDYASALALDGSGNLYVTGYSYGSGTYSDYATIKYAPNGDTLWVRRYNGPANGYDYASALALDGSGNLYVTGYSYGSGTYSDYATIKYAPNGDTLWVRRYNGPANGYDDAYALAVDQSGNIYVTGESDLICFWGGCDGGDYTTIKYAPNGDTLWVSRYNSGGLDEANALAADRSGNVYVKGVTGHISCGGDYDAPPSCYYKADYSVIIRYAPSGDTSWVRLYDGTVDSSDVANALAVDDSGKVYVTGRSIGDYATIKYAPNGDSLWVRRYNGPGNGGNVASVIAVDTGGNVYVTGSSDGDYTTIKYNKFGCAAMAGDVNSDYQVDLSDIMLQINYLFKSGPKPDPFCSGDANANGNILLTDIVYLINYIFRSGPAPIKSNECCL